MPARSLRVAYSAEAMAHCPVWILKESGHLEREGINLELTYLQGGAMATVKVLSGEIPIASIGTTAAVRAFGRGSKDLVLIGGVLNRPSMSAIAHPGIHRPEDLRGKRAAITRFGGPTDFTMCWILRRWKLEPVKDVSLVQVGDVPSLIAALESGNAAVTVIDPPGRIMLLKRGFRKMIDVAEAGLRYQVNSLLTTRSFVEKNEVLVSAFMKGYLDAIRDLKQDRTKALDVLQKYLKTKDAEALQDTYEMLKKDVPSDGALDMPGIETIIHEELPPEERRGIRAEDLVDLRFIRK